MDKPFPGAPYDAWKTAEPDEDVWCRTCHDSGECPACKGTRLETDEDGTVYDDICERCNGSGVCDCCEDEGV